MSPNSDGSWRGYESAGQGPLVCDVRLARTCFTVAEFKRIHLPLSLGHRGSPRGVCGSLFSDGGDDWKTPAVVAARLTPPHPTVSRGAHLVLTRPPGAAADEWAGSQKYWMGVHS